MRISSRLLLLVTALALVAPATGVAADTDVHDLADAEATGANDLDGAADPDAEVGEAAPDGATEGGADGEGAPGGDGEDGRADVAGEDDGATAAGEDAAMAADESSSTGGFEVRDDVADVGDPRPEVRFRGAGWGHGVGMSQYGAYAMAREGRTFREILSHYYPGTETHRASQHGVDTTRASIRVGLLQGLSNAPVEARAGEPVWEVCDPGSSPMGAGECREIDNRHTPQPQGTTWRACPRSGGGIEVREGPCNGDDEAVRFTTGRDIVRVRHAGGAIVAPIGSFGVPREIRRGFHEIRRVDGQLRTIQQLPTIEEYLYGLFEMPGGWGDRGGSAALQAQAVTGRTFAISRHRSPRGNCNCHLLATPADQAWYGHIQETGTGGERWRAAVDATRTSDPEEGIVLTHGGVLAQTFYSSSHGGRTENIEDSWAYGTTPISYLRAMDDPWSLDGDVGNPYRSWVGTRDNAAVAELLSRGVDGTMRTVEQIRIRNRTEGGTPRELEVRGRAADGTVVSGTYTGPGSGKAIAGAHLRTSLPGVTVINANGATANLSTLPSSQIRRIGFGPFDDDDGSVHEYATVWAHEAGIAQGRTETRFNPGGSVTRAQMAAFLYRTFDIPEPSGDQFDDVAADHPHGEAINALAEAGVAQGFDDDTFRPGSRVTRAQMASFLRRALGLDEVEPDGRFDDVGGGAHAGAIHAIGDARITQGCTATSFCPQDTVARGQMTTFLHRAVKDDR
jgi:SpoIID/LytB domain protein